MTVEFIAGDTYRVLIAGREAAANETSASVLVDRKALQKLIDDAQETLELERRLRALEAANVRAGETP